ncbi:MAG: DUF1559 domain-containing protein [Planctomycetaceae bacterium]|nr:DUF1559 domain-containing protein [Planctomycetaceae bacterium]MBT6484473.1 DUF1559 domain-containing protein [Planctomycetaceae bacterium]
MSEVPTTETVPPECHCSLSVPCVHILYAVALPSSAILLFNPIAIIISPILLTAWAVVFYSRSRPLGLCIVCVLAFLHFCLYSVFSPSAHQTRVSDGRPRCKNNLKQIMLAMHNYHEDFGSFPPAVVTDDNGHPMHSWRVLILPYLDEAKLHNAYRFDEPWDSEVNRKLLVKMPHTYVCSTHNSTQNTEHATSFVAVVGPRTCWAGLRGRTLNEIIDGTNKSVMIVETDSHSIPWTEPRDIDLSTAVRLLGSADPGAIGSHQRKEFFFEYQPVRHVALADGRVGSAPAGLNAEFAEQLLIVDDGGPPGDWDTSPLASQPHRKLRMFNTFRFALFAVLAVLPLPWVWLNPRPRETRQPAAT